MSQTSRSASLDWPLELASCPGFFHLLRLALRTQPRSERCIVGGGVKMHPLKERLVTFVSDPGVLQDYRAHLANK